MKRNDAAHHSGPDDGHSSGSDEDRNAVEVVFDPSNPYRRKSSLVSSDAVAPYLYRHAATKTECLVHQVLESQKQGPRHHDHPPQRSTSRHSRPPTRGNGATAIARDISEEAGLNRPQDPKGALSSSPAKLDSSPNNTPQPKPPRCVLLDPSTPSSSDDADPGQLDEKEWRATMTSAPAPPPPHTSAIAGSDADADPTLHSRLLTKKQLSEMAWGVRELSRRLGSIRLKFRVKSIFVLTKIHDRELVATTRELTAWLLAQPARYTVYVEGGVWAHRLFDAEGLIAEAGGGEDDTRRRLRTWDEDMCRARPHTFDFVITLGGDGTVLYASWLFQRIVPPVLSFALGSLGFLTKFDFGGFREILTAAFRDGVSVSLRLRFEGTEEMQKQRDLVDELIGEEKDDERTHRPDGTFEVLNEVVVDRGPNPTMSETEIFGDDEHFTTVMADGVCVSTPTGSTAYNLAAGGSLCHPENPVMLLTAISPHTLSFRPVILPDTIVMRLGVPYAARTSSWASFDGRERIELHPGDYVTISASRYPFASVQMHGRRSEDWINSISKKLAWNSRSRPKAYTEMEGGKEGEGRKS
ncbi:ATP-NAD kinase-like domain-containing protein [Schizothecium vesticola]|uniref:ATP-NAD kinase-like domain-containing protein n=1 Tax=Schizothecium vesticola TaxID=314040 RepID=A0AA40KAT3_9PEZI|nr:ATP-NAD kinase-like domain-containing protein [Schizothecium vesticola]